MMMLSLCLLWFNREDKTMNKFQRMYATSVASVFMCWILFSILVGMESLTNWLTNAHVPIPVIVEKRGYSIGRTYGKGDPPEGTLVHSPDFYWTEVYNSSHSGTCYNIELGWPDRFEGAIYDGSIHHVGCHRHLPEHYLRRRRWSWFTLFTVILCIPFPWILPPTHHIPPPPPVVRQESKEEEIF